MWPTKLQPSHWTALPAPREITASLARTVQSAADTVAPSSAVNALSQSEKVQRSRKTQEVAPLATAVVYTPPPLRLQHRVR